MDSWECNRVSGVLQLTSFGEVNIGKGVVMLMAWSTASVTNFFLLLFLLLLFFLDTQFVFGLFPFIARDIEKLSWIPGLSMPQVQCSSFYAVLCLMYQAEE